MAADDPRITAVVSQTPAPVAPGVVVLKDDPSQPDQASDFWSDIVYFTPQDPAHRRVIFLSDPNGRPFADSDLTPYGLSMAVITEDYRAMRMFREECEFGMGYVNLPCIGAEVHLPFGGVKKSGNGHPSAAGLIETVTHKIAWTVNHGTEIKMAQGLTTNVE